MIFSGKDLCTKSCAQIKMLQLHPELKQDVSANVHVQQGERFQKAVADTLYNIIGCEMRNTFTNGIHTIHFSHDIVCEDKIVEVKSVRGIAPDWYLKSSLLQCAIYKAFIMMGCSHLQTATFYKNLTGEDNEAYADATVPYYLVFGEEIYKVTVTNPEAIVSYMVRKANACCGSWDKAKSFDAQYKHREWDELQHTFYYEQVMVL